MAKAKVEAAGLEAVMEMLNKQYGKNSVLALDSKSDGHYDLISSGSIGFDYKCLGVGGFVKGKLYELMGWEGTGKSTICGHAVANCQITGGRVAYIDGEHAVDRNYFQALGVDTRKLIIAQPSCGEEGFNIAMELIKSDEIDMLIIDSDSSLIPKKVIEGDVGDSALGLKARLNSSVYQKMKNLANKHNVCVIVVSQYREKIGVMFGNPTTTQGGHALKYTADVRIEVSRTLAKDGDVTFANKTKVKATKNKMAPPFRLAEFNVVYGEGIDKVGEMMELMNDFEIGRKYGKTFTVDDVKHDLEEFKSKLSSDTVFYDEMKAKIIAKINESDLPVEEIEVLDVEEIVPPVIETQDEY